MTSPSPTPSRRTVVAAAWAAPTITVLSAAPSFAASGTIAPGASNGIARTRTLNLLLTLTPAPADPLTVADVAALYSAPDTTTTAFAPTGGGTGPGATYVLTATTSTTPAPDSITVSGAIRGYGTIPSTVVELVKAGGRDTAFLASSVRGQVKCLAVQPDGRILVGGNLFDVNGNGLGRLVRLLPDGSRDTSFDVGSGFNLKPWALHVQADGRIVVGGEFTTFRGAAAPGLVRLSSTGSLDAGFAANVGTGTTSPGSPGVLTMAPQSDGRLIIGGNFDRFNGTSARGIARISADGVLDQGFTAATAGGLVNFQGGNGTALALAIAPDDSVTVGGVFATAGGTAAGHLARFQADGRPDATFLAGIGSGADGFVHALVLQPDGRVVVGGQFTSFAGATTGNLVRLLPTGARDTSFTPATVAYGVFALAQQPDGRLIVGGNFTSVGSITVNGIVRLDANGARETIFTVNTGTGFAVGSFLPGTIQRVLTLAQQPDRALVVGGDFVSHDGVTNLGCVVRLFG